MDTAHLGDYDKRIIRQAMLDAQTRWLDEATTAETTTLRTLATLIADVFRQEADTYKNGLSMEGWASGDVSSIGANGHDELGATPFLSAESGGEGGTSRTP